MPLLTQQKLMAEHITSSPPPISSNPVRSICLLSIPELKFQKAINMVQYHHLPPPQWAAIREKEESLDPGIVKVRSDTDNV
jgi:hypothetical protein